MIVIYDGQCRFCSACLYWLERKCELSAHAFQETDLSRYGLTQEQCSKEVFCIDGEATYSGAQAVALLFEYRGNRRLAWVIRSSGKLGKFGYRWLANHRNSWLVREVTLVLEKINSRNS